MPILRRTGAICRWISSIRWVERRTQSVTKWVCSQVR